MWVMIDDIFFLLIHDTLYFWKLVGGKVEIPKQCLGLVSHWVFILTNLLSRKYSKERVEAISRIRFFKIHNPPFLSLSISSHPFSPPHPSSTPFF